LTGPRRSPFVSGSPLRFPGGPFRGFEDDAAEEEVAWAPTAHGDLSLRRRPEPDGHRGSELVLDGTCLSSTQYAVGGVEIVRRALVALGGDRWDVAVLGLGLGLTTGALLDDRRVESVLVVEGTPEIVSWARAGLIPGGPRIIADRRVSVVVGDVSTALRRDGGFDAIFVNLAALPSTRAGALHSVWGTVAGLRELAEALRPDGVFALWSDLPPDVGSLRALRSVFDDVLARPLAFENRAQGLLAVHTMYVGRQVCPPRNG
jgi:spermidine synthase